MSYHKDMNLPRFNTIPRGFLILLMGWFAWLQLGLCCIQPAYAQTHDCCKPQPNQSAKHCMVLQKKWVVSPDPLQSLQPLSATATLTGPDPHPSRLAFGPSLNPINPSILNTTTGTNLSVLLITAPQHRWCPYRLARSNPGGDSDEPSVT